MLLVLKVEVMIVAVMIVAVMTVSNNTTQAYGNAHGGDSVDSNSGDRDNMTEDTRNTL